MDYSALAPYHDNPNVHLPIEYYKRRLSRKKKKGERTRRDGPLPAFLSGSKTENNWMYLSWMNLILVNWSFTKGIQNQ